ncbi:hypothetical protein Q2941_33555 [Bradyrhizobium sp. UFLA05-153]
MLQVRTYVLIAFAVAGTGARSETVLKNPVITEKTAVVVESVYHEDPKFQRAVRLWNKRVRLENTAREMKLSGDRATRFIEGSYERYKETQDPANLSDTYSGALFKTIADGAHVGPIADKFLNDRERDLKNKFEKEPLESGQEIVKAAIDDDDPKHESAIELLKEAEDWNRNKPALLQPKVEETLRDENLFGSNEKNQESLNKLLNDGVKLTPEQQKDLEAKLEEAVKKVFEEDRKQVERLKELAKKRADSIEKHGRDSVYWGTLTPQERADFYRNESQDRQQTMGAIGGIAHITGNRGLEVKAHQAAELDKRITEMVATNLTKSFARNPGLYLNAYVGVVAAISDLFQSEEKDNSMSAVMDVLKQIAKEIRELREEMNLRFDQLDANMKSQFDQTFSVLGSIADGQSLMASEVRVLSKNLERMRLEMKTGFRTSWSQMESPMVAKCFEAGLSADIIKECRTYYAALAHNEVPEKNETSPAELSKQELREFSQGMKKANVQTEELTIHPATWLYAANNFSKIFQLNPEQKDLAKASSEVQPDWTLAGMIRAGQHIIRATGGLLLRKDKDEDEFTLNARVLKNLRNQYRTAAALWIDNGRKIASKQAMQGPNPFLKGSEPFMDHSLRALAIPMEVDMCPDVTDKKVILGAGAKDLWQAEADKQNSEFKKSWVKLGKELLSAPNAIPNDIRWALKMGEQHDLTSDLQFANVKIKPCFHKIELMSFWRKNDNMKFHLRIELEVHLTYQRFGEKDPREVLITRGLLDDTRDLNWFPTYHTSNCGFFLRYWNEVCPCTAGGVGAKIWDSIASTFASRFTFEVVDNKDLTEFRKYFNDFESRLEASAAEDFKGTFGKAPKGELDEKRMLTLPVVLGLDGSNENVQNYLSLITTDSGLPSKETVTDLAMKGVRRETIMDEIDDRLAIVDTMIELLGKDKTLLPNIEPYQSVLNELRALAK